MGVTNITFNPTVIVDNTWSSVDQDGDNTQITDPMLLVDFNGLADGQSVVSTVNDPGSVSGKRFDAVLGNIGFAGGFGVQAKAGTLMSGKTSFLRASIAEGSEGDPAGGGSGVGYGCFGGIIGFDEPIFEGDELWLGFPMFIPSDFSFETNTGLLKYIRMDTNFNVGRIEYMVVNGLYNGQPEANQVGWGLLREGVGNTKPQSETNFVSNRNLVKGQVNWVEMYMLASYDPNVSIRRIWCNEQFICERVGNVNKYINSTGVLTTQVIGSGERILSQADDSVTNFYLSTYWNGDSPQDQYWDVQHFVGTNDPAKPQKVDEYGNKMMGWQYR